MRRSSFRPITRLARNPSFPRRADPKPQVLAPLLLDWYSEHARDLPWRRTRDPYAIWISEIMLQQTQVKTVVPYWRRWMRELPTIESLAKVTPGKIHKLWEGLGYYTRVRNLQKAARTIVKRHGGRFPELFQEVLSLPGIGRYTAGAICSIAFNHPTPVLDGNVIRVFTRVFGITGNPREKKTNTHLWQLAQELVDEARTGARSCASLNQSLMELGALVCMPREPRCDECPVASHCFARERGCVDKLPALAPRPAAVARRFAAFLVQHRGRFLVRQRPPGAVNAHLWEFPNTEIRRPGCNLRSAARKALGFTPANMLPHCTIHHTITRYRIELDAMRIDLSPEAAPVAVKGRWRTAAQLAQLPFPSAHKRLLRLLESKEASSGCTNPASG